MNSGHSAGRDRWPDQVVAAADSGLAGHRHPVLAGYNGSDTARHALAYAAGMARRLDRWLVVVYVWRGTGFAPISLAEQMRWLQADLADSDLSGLDIEMIVRCGNPASELRRMTAERNADVIVIGASKRSRHRFAGSVPARLARHAWCPAVIVP